MHFIRMDIFHTVMNCYTNKSQRCCLAGISDLKKTQLLTTAAQSAASFVCLSVTVCTAITSKRL